MKVIFLDIDGVLVNFTSMKLPRLTLDGQDFSTHRFYQPAVVALNRIVRETGAKIVISSSWRGGRDSIPKLQRILDANGVIGEIVGVTPCYDGTESTGEKLNAWMEKNGGRYHPERRNVRSVWSIAAQPLSEAHFATFPEALAEKCILAGCPLGGIVLDPFAGSFTTCRVAFRLGRHSIGIELNPEYIEIGRRRCNKITPVLPLEKAL